MQAINRWLVILLLAALGVRLAWVLSRPTDQRLLADLPDQIEYLSAGRNLLAGNSLKFVDPRFGQTVYAFRTPGYPAFIAACDGSIPIIRIAQAVLDTFTVLAAFLLARNWLSARASLLAAAIVAFNPFLIYFTGLILTEMLFTAMLAWALVLLVAKDGKFWIWGGVILALSVLVRPAAIGLPVLLGVMATIVNRRGRRPYQHWSVAGGIMLLLTLLALFPWALRNHRVLGRWIWTDTNAGFTAYDGFNPNATGASNQNFVQAMPRLRQMTEVQRSDYLTADARDFIAEHPLRSAELAVVKLLRTWSPQPLSTEFSRPAYVIVAWSYDAPFYALVLIGLGFGMTTRRVRDTLGGRDLKPSPGTPGEGWVRALHDTGNRPHPSPLPEYREREKKLSILSHTAKRPAKLLLLAPAAYLTMIAMLSVGSLRYRIPADVPLAVIAAWGAAAPLSNRRVGPALPDNEAESGTFKS